MAPTALKQVLVMGMRGLNDPNAQFSVERVKQMIADQTVKARELGFDFTTYYVDPENPAAISELPIARWVTSAVASRRCSNWRGTEFRADRMTTKFAAARMIAAIATAIRKSRAERCGFDSEINVDEFRRLSREKNHNQQQNTPPASAHDRTREPRG